MCGIAGRWDVRHRLPAEEAAAAIRRMTRSLAHRGPDDEGYYQEAEAGLDLGHRRLSILDLSPLGHQPMLSPGGRYVVVYNGEIYNFAELRRDLQREGVVFRGHSDTEVVLAAIESWGLDAAIGRCVGMFAIALWDRQRRVLSLVRDRLGIKPLYYGWAGGAFVFGSELKALCASPGARMEIDPGAVSMLLRRGYVPAPHAIYASVRKLMPGTILEVDAAAATSPQDIDTLEGRARTFWSAAAVARQGIADPFAGTDAEAIDQLDALLRLAVSQRMVADVPLGAFLSGGIDSSTVVALMQAQSGRPIKTFSIGFEEKEYDEAEHARAVARHIGTEHTELRVTAAEAMATIPELPRIYDEPLSDYSQIPTYLVSKLARTQVIVSLSGDGGDELFAGYGHYFWALRLWSSFRWIPRPLRAAVGRGLRGMPPALQTSLAGMVMPLLPARMRVERAANRLQVLGELLPAASLDALYGKVVSHWDDPASLLRGIAEPVLERMEDAARLADPLQRMMLGDLMAYLPDDILAKVDRASMAVGLEARVPLIDHRVVEFAWRLPMGLKVRDARGKWLLRQVLHRYVPQNLVDRPKQGFGLPVEHWLRGPLRGWAEDLLEPGSLSDFFEPGPIRKAWSEHLSGHRAHHYKLWDILMFQAWRKSLDKAQGAPVDGIPP
jgi:asparagine synthase (glutamine-hydrolysing)